MARQDHGWLWSAIAPAQPIRQLGVTPADSAWNDASGDPCRRCMREPHGTFTIARRGLAPAIGVEVTATPAESVPVNPTFRSANCLQPGWRHRWVGPDREIVVTTADGQRNFDAAKHGTDLDNLPIFPAAQRVKIQKVPRDTQEPNAIGRIVTKSDQGLIPIKPAVQVRGVDE